MTSEFINSIDNFISNMKVASSPPNAYENYCNENNIIIMNEINNL